MVAVLLRCRAELRARWKAWLALALVVGIAGAVVMAVAAGARRTDTALARFEAASNVPDVFVVKADTTSPLDLEQVARLPEVAVSARAVQPIFHGRLESGRLVGTTDFGILVPVDGAYSRVLDTTIITSGRDVDPRRVDEVSMPSGMARRYGLEVGSTIRMRFWTPEDAARIGELYSAYDIEGLFDEFPPVADPDTHGTGPLLDFHVVGIWADPGDVGGVVFLSPAFFREYGDRILVPGDLLVVRLHGGEADIGSFQAGAERIAAGEPVLFGDSGVALREIQRSIHVQAESLWLVAGLGALVATLVLLQAIVRQAALESVDEPALRALGMTRRQLTALALGRGVVVAVPGVALALAIAIALSPLMPIGMAREAETDPGFAIDPIVLGIGAAVVLAVVLGSVFLAARRAGSTAAAGAASARRQASSIVALAGRLRLPQSGMAGVRMALERGQGRTAVPVRSTLVGATLAVAAVVTALSFNASLDHLLTTPRLYGQSWDAVGGYQSGPEVGDAVVAAIAARPEVAELSTGTYGSVVIAGRRVDVLAMQPVKGSIQPVVLDGRSPSAPDEIVLGSETLEAVDAEVGDDVEVSVGDTTVVMHVVGRGVMPDIGENLELGLGTGGAATLEGLQQLVPEAGRSLFHARSAPGLDANDAFAEFFYPWLGLGGSRDPVRPSDVGRFGGVDSMPGVIMGVFGAVAVAALAHTLVTLTRRRRRDLAVLKTLGFTRGQVAAAVAWQATIVAGIGLLVGLPIGVALGRWAWTLFAEDLGVVPEPVTPLWPVLLVVPATLLLANLVAALPGRIAAKTQPALVLRAE